MGQAKVSTGWKRRSTLINRFVTRQPKGWVGYFTTKDALKHKLLDRQLHLIHGKDVARAILAVHLGVQKYSQLRAQRWILTDQRCYDWLRLFLAWASDDQIRTLQHLLDYDQDIQKKWGRHQTLDRLVKEGLKPRLDSKSFWDSFRLVPTTFLAIE
jgi:hypothetical protein